MREWKNFEGSGGAESDPNIKGFKLRVGVKEMKLEDTSHQHKYKNIKQTKNESSSSS